MLVVKRGGHKAAPLSRPIYTASRSRSTSRMGGLSEQPLVLPAELRGVVVAHPVASAGGIQILAEQDAPGLLETELLLEL